MKTRIVHTKIWEDDWFANLSRSSKLVFLYLITCKENNICGAFESSDRIVCFNAQVTQAELDQAKEDLSDKIIFFDGWVKINNTDKYNNYRFSKKNEKAYNREIELMPDHVREFFSYEFTMEEFREKKYQKTGGQYVHRTIAEKVLGRKLEPNEVVHHIDKNPENNDPSNLAVMDEDKHKLLHQGKIKIEDTNMILVSEKKILVINHKSKIINKKLKNKYSSINDLTDDVVRDVANTHNVYYQDVHKLKERLKYYNDQNGGNKYKNYKAALNNWVLRAIEDGKIQQIKNQSVSGKGKLSKMIDERKA